MNYLKLVKNMKTHFIERLPHLETMAYFGKDRVSYWIWFSVLENYYKKNSNGNIQSIMEDIPNKFGSRPTIFKIINDAVAKKYFIKTLNKKDKREFNLYPSEKTIKEFEEWTQIFKDI